MAKRLTDTNIWEKEWFMDLSPKMKCFVRFLDDHCDHAGVWNVNFKLTQMYIGESVKEELNTLPEGFFYEFDGGKKWFLPKFIEIQNGNIFREVPDGKRLSPIIGKVINKLKGHKYKKDTLYEFYYRLYNTLPIECEKEEEEEEESYKEEEEDSFGKSENLLTTTERIDGVRLHDQSVPSKLWEDEGWRSGLRELFGVDDKTLLPYWDSFWKHLRAGASQLDKRPIDKLREHFRNWLNKQDFNSNGTTGEIDLSKI